MSAYLAHGLRRQCLQSREQGKPLHSLGVCTVPRCSSVLRRKPSLTATMIGQLSIPAEDLDDELQLLGLGVAPELGNGPPYLEMTDCGPARQCNACGETFPAIQVTRARASGLIGASML